MFYVSYPFMTYLLTLPHILLNGGIRFFQNIGVPLPNYIASHSGIPYSGNSPQISHAASIFKVSLLKVDVICPQEISMSTCKTVQCQSPVDHNENLYKT
jgi:hypothetical protein